MPEPSYPARRDRVPGAGIGSRAVQALGRILRGAGAFGWDFIGADHPELIIGVAVLLAVIGALVALGSRGAAAALAPVLVVALLSVSLRRALRTGRRRT